jgi:hypothetical protein
MNLNHVYEVGFVLSSLICNLRRNFVIHLYVLLLDCEQFLLPPEESYVASRGGGGVQLWKALQ